MATHVLNDQGIIYWIVSGILLPAHMHIKIQLAFFAQGIQAPSCHCGILQRECIRRKNCWIVSKHFSERCLMIQKFQFTKIINFNGITVFKKNTNFGGAARGAGRWILSCYSRMVTASSWFIRHRKQLRSSSKKYRDYSCFPLWLLDLCLCWGANTVYLISYSIKMMLRKPQGKLKSKRVSLDMIILLSWVDHAIK